MGPRFHLWCFKPASSDWWTQSQEQALSTWNCDPKTNITRMVMSALSLLSIIVSFPLFPSFHYCSSWCSCCNDQGGVTHRPGCGAHQKSHTKLQCLHTWLQWSLRLALLQLLHSCTRACWGSHWAEASKFWLWCSPAASAVSAHKMLSESHSSWPWCWCIFFSCTAFYVSCSFQRCSYMSMVMELQLDIAYGAGHHTQQRRQDCTLQM